MRRFLSAGSLALILVACSDPVWDTQTAENADAVWANPPNCAPDAPGVSLPTAQHDSLPPFVPHLNRLEDVWQLVAVHVPGGWAGFAFPESSSVIPTGQMPPRPDILFVDTTHIAESLGSLAIYYPLYFPNLHFVFQRDSVGIRVVRWSWVQLHDWYRYLVLAGPPNGVLRAAFSFDDGNRLSFGVATAADRTALLQRFSQLGVPCWLAQVYIGGGGGGVKVAQPPPAAPGVIAP